MRNCRGVTLIELLVVGGIVAVLAVIGFPEINRFTATYKVRSAATDVVQEIRLAKALARRYNARIVMDIDYVNNLYTYGIDRDRDDVIDTGAGVDPQPRTIRMRDYGAFVEMAISPSVAVGPKIDAAPATPVQRINKMIFFPDGTADQRPANAVGAPFFIPLQHQNMMYTYAVYAGGVTGRASLYRWKGDKDNTAITEWLEQR